MFEGKRKNKRTALSDVSLQWLLNSNAIIQNSPNVSIEFECIYPESTARRYCSCLSEWMIKPGHQNCSV